MPAALQAMRRVSMVLHHLALDNSDTNTDPFTVWTYTYLHGQVGAQDTIGATYTTRASQTRGAASAKRSLNKVHIPRALHREEH